LRHRPCPLAPEPQPRRGSHDIPARPAVLHGRWHQR